MSSRGTSRELRSSSRPTVEVQAGGLPKRVGRGNRGLLLEDSEEDFLNYLLAVWDYSGPLRAF